MKALVIDVVCKVTDGLLWGIGLSLGGAFCKWAFHLSFC